MPSSSQVGAPGQVCGLGGHVRHLVREQLGVVLVGRLEVARVQDHPAADLRRRLLVVRRGVVRRPAGHRVEGRHRDRRDLVRALQRGPEVGLHQPLVADGDHDDLPPPPGRPHPGDLRDRGVRDPHQSAQPSPVRRIGQHQHVLALARDHRAPVPRVGVAGLREVRVGVAVAGDQPPVAALDERQGLRPRDRTRVVALDGVVQQDRRQVVGHVVGVGQVRPVVVAADQLVAPGREVDLGQAGEHGPLGGQEPLRPRVDVGQPGLLVVVQHRVRPPAEHGADRLVPRTRPDVGSRRAASPGAPPVAPSTATRPDDERHDQHDRRSHQPPAPRPRHAATPSPSAPAATLGVVRNGAADQALVTDVRHRLRAAGDATKAAQMQAYMKSALPFHGVNSPDCRVIMRDVLATHALPDRATWQATVLALWDDAGHREERYAALASPRTAGTPGTATRTSCRCTDTCWSPAPGGTSSTTSPPTWSGRCCWRTPPEVAPDRAPPGRPTRTGGCAARR